MNETSQRLVGGGAAGAENSRVSRARDMDGEGRVVEAGDRAQRSLNWMWVSGYRGVATQTAQEYVTHCDGRETFGSARARHPKRKEKTATMWQRKVHLGTLKQL